MLCGLVTLAAALPAVAAELPVAPLTVETAKGAVTFTVEEALTPEQQQTGLMDRDSLAVDRGMLFDFGTTRMVSMWMRNTRIPLDMIFIRSDGTIARIAAMTTPYSEAIVSSGEPVAAVLEINGGQAEARGIARGDRVRHRIFAGP